MIDEPPSLVGAVKATVSCAFSGVIRVMVGAPGAVAVGGAFSLVGSAVFALRLPRIRVEARQLIVAQQAGAGEPPEEATGQGLVGALPDSELDAARGRDA